MKCISSVHRRNSGPGGLDALAGLPLSAITEAGRFRATDEEWLGDDRLNVYERAG
jgi:hypothetical protein